MPLSKKPAIIMCLTPEYIKDKMGSEEKLHERFALYGGTDSWTWHLPIRSVPSKHLKHCYLVFSGKVQYKLSIIGYMPVENKALSHNKYMLKLCNPKKATRIIPRANFISFQYTDELF
jgi:hypothetical protein